MRNGAPKHASKAGPGRRIIVGLSAAWALLVAAGILASLWEIVPRMPLIFKDAELRASIESGDSELHRLVSSSESACRTERKIVALTDDEENYLFIDYRLAYLLYPTRVNLFLADFVPPHPTKFGVRVSVPVMDMIIRNDIGTALFLVRGQPELSGCFGVKPVSDSVVSFTRLPGDSHPSSAPGAKHWYLWPLGLASLPFLGFALAMLFRPGPAFSGFRPRAAAFYFLAGTGITGWFMILLSIAGIRWSLPLLCAPWLVLGGWALVSRRPVLQAGRQSEPEGRSSLWMDTAGKSLVAVAVLLAASKASIPMSAWSNWDAWAVWGMKAKAFWETGGLSFFFLRDEFFAFSHHEYPPGFPAVQTYLAFFSGGLDERLMRLLSPVFGLALAFLMAELAESMGLRRTRWLLAGLTVCGFKYVEQAGNGYADLPVACGMAACLLALALVQKGEAKAWVVGFLGGVCGLIKSEGLIWAAGCLAVVLFWTAAKKIRARDFAAALLVFMALSAPWKGISSRLALKPIDYEFSFARMIRNIPQSVPVIFKGMVLNMLGPGATMQTMAGEGVTDAAQWWSQFKGGWPLLWCFTLACLYLGRRSLLRTPQREILGVVLLQILAYWVVYLVSLQDLDWHIVTSMDRLLFQVAPCVVVLGASAARDFLEGAPGELRAGPP